MSARVVADDGGVLAQAAATAVGAGEFQSFDFARAGIGASGDPSTGRLQMRVEVTIVGQTKYLDIVLKRGTSRLFHSAVEVIDDVSGGTSVSMPSTNEQSEHTAMIEFRNSDSGMIASAARASFAMKATSMNTEQTSSGHTRSDPQPCCGTHVSASSSGTTVAISNAKPAQSIWWFDGRGFMIVTLASLAFWQIKNRIRVRLARLKQPRYLVGSIAGIAYITYFAILRNPGFSGSRRAANFARFAGSMELGAALALLLLAALVWILPAAGSPVRFSASEIQFLFPAPITRRQLLQYRLLRAQLGLLFGSAMISICFVSLTPRAFDNAARSRSPPAASSEAAASLRYAALRASARSIELAERTLMSPAAALIRATIGVTSTVRQRAVSMVCRACITSNWPLRAPGVSPE